MTPAPVIIAVDGRSGAGKTTLAVELAARLRVHHKVSLFHLEDIYPGWNGLAAGIERYVTTVLAPLRNGDAAEWVSWDWQNHYDGRSHVTLPAEIVIVEGVGAAASAARPMLDAVVWVDAPDDERKHRALARDGSTYEQFWDSWASQEDEWLETDDVLEHLDIRVRNRADGNASEDVLQALNYLPSLSPVLAPELSARRGLSLNYERHEGVLADPAALFSELYGGSPRAVWLDSSNASGDSTAPGADRRRFSIMADDSGAFGQWARHSDGVTTITAGQASVAAEGLFFRWLNSVWGRRTLKGPDGYECGFTLGWLGYLGYELKRETGGSNVRAHTPDAQLIFAGRAVVLDHQSGDVWALTLDPDDAEWLARVRHAVVRSPRKDVRAPGTPPVPSFSSRDTEDEYKRKITGAQNEIAEGNTYEVCLTTTVSAKDPGLDPWESYLALRHRNPAPFASYLRFGELTVASTSPERFLRITSDGGMRAEPIKGTRARANDPVIDEALRRGLESSLKDRAENIMIVDLLRNDLSHFAVPGSVTVSRLCAVESYATVHQMVSTIDAQLRPGAPRAEAVAAAFPAGSMTGAPKISTMDILDELESGPRGVYSGAIGYFSLNAATDLAVVIRTLVMGPDGDGGRTLSLGVGGAITADSTPLEEYEEVRTKAFGVLSALGAEFPEG
ncbi:aminodeoxychorismate synthase component I [Arthrobacter sp. AZCC_0090]|uniref:aminodeoxychorismate synthase component I n=1 Tax=Arthrobacter sp. AZCC_0090 TaxID=2735881 RepID=UPI001615AF2A|nr:aminodeoxychorismate synthase component I [Arthrobacter sp. AZCC_0090]MBB6405314.1 anthranilate synthase component 1/para-aminobenzoate synthetase [Arthrobacter sp. AZCC_0090]